VSKDNVSKTDKSRKRESLREEIRAERRRIRGLEAKDVAEMVIDGETIPARGNLLFHTDPRSFPKKLDSLLTALSDSFSDQEGTAQMHILSFLTRLAIDLQSFLPHWVLGKGESGLATASLEEAVRLVKEALGALSGRAEEATSRLIEDIRKSSLARLKAEGIEGETEAQRLAADLLRGSLQGYVDNLAEELKASNLMRAAEARLGGDGRTELGNDYAVFLPYMIWLGGSFVTTNPVLIKVAWDTDRDTWDERVDRLIISRFAQEELGDLLEGNKARLEAAVTEINSLVTMSVVEENCRLLRDIFLITEGSEGYVSLQVNPKNHDDAERMVSEALTIYKDLRERLGGVPNVVFKLPATAAGLRAAERLTSQGIGVTITVSFSVFQAVAFGEVLDRGQALVTYIALMNGRMAFPVRDEMKEQATEGGVEAARWAGVEVARKAYRCLYGGPESGGRGIDPERVKLLIASLRIYGDWIPDISEQWGCPVITFFPNVRRTYDTHKRELKTESILDRTPEQQLRILLESEIFRQAWWIPGDPESQKPKRVLTVNPEDGHQLISWPPIANTIRQFIDLYEEMGQMVKGRMRELTSDSKGASHG
jgi:transaldolase